MGARIEIPRNRSLADAGVRFLEDWLTEQEMQKLRDESRAQQIIAGKRSEDLESRLIDGAFWAENRLTSAPAGPAAIRVWRDRRLIETISEIAGIKLTPTRVSLVDYRPGDYIAPHLDHDVCNYTGIIPLTSPIQSLQVYAEMADTKPSELFSKVQAGEPLGSVSEARLPANGILLFPGGSVPHKSPVARTHRSIVSMCFGVEPDLKWIDKMVDIGALSVEEGSWMARGELFD
nr:hypothetical protein [Streptomyces chartreusis]